MLIKKRQKKVTNLSEKKWPPLGGLKKSDTPYSESISLDRGDALFSFSDGFTEEFKKHSSKSLNTHLVSVTTALKGDAESIGVKLLKILGDILKRGKAIEDDISFLIISSKTK